MHPGLELPDRSSDNWAAIVFGATSRNRFVNASDGVGILFRNNGAIQVFDGGAAAYTSAPNLLPEGAFRVRIESKASDFHGGSPATIRMFINDAPFQITPSGTELVKSAGFRANYITLLGIGEGLTHAFDDFKVTAVAGINAMPSNITILPGETSAPLTIKIPAGMNTGKAATVKITSDNPGAAIPEGAVNGVLTLTFPAGSAVTQTINILATGKGRATLALSNTEGVLVGDPVVVTVPSGFIRNPSFEQNYNPTFPSYSDVAAWDKIGGTGVNRANGPFHDNGSIPDREQIAFLQGNATISQTISGLTPGKKYWLQVRYNSRGCCGGATPDLTVRFEGADIEKITGITPVGGANEYYSRNFVFVPEASSGLLEFAGSAAGDATTLLDGITIVQRDDGNVIVNNPSFEASGETAAPGVISPRKISGWTGVGTYGVNFGGSGYANNGASPDQDMVAFINGAGSLSQQINGLVAGEIYTVSYGYNASSGNQPRLKVTAGATVLQDQDISPVAGAAAYAVKTATFTAADSSIILTFAQTKEGDQTTLIDNVMVKGKAVVLPPIKVAPGTFDLNIVQRGSLVTVTIPAQLTANNAASITVTSQNPAVAIPAGAVNGSLDLVFPVGGATEKTFEVIPVGNGSTRFLLSNRLGAQFETDSVAVSVSGSFVRNPSFEANSHPTFPGYGAINGWAGAGPGNTGINNAGGPFHDNGVIPDRNQVALLQTSKTISQTILGLVPGKKYWLQFYNNTRNCCGGSINLTARFAGADLTTIEALTPVGGVNSYNFQQVEFTPAETSGDLEFATDAQGDATALLDAVSIVQRDAGSIVIQNPSFEASGPIGFPGYIQPRLIAGWKGAGNYGVNVSGAGPFADNGKNSDQDAVAFIQDKNASLSQTISGLTAGQRYTLSYAYNARGGNAPRIKVTIGGQTAQDEDVAPVGASNAYRVKQFAFTAEGETADLVFTQTATGDHTLLIDDVEITPGGAAPEVRLAIERAGNTVKLRWPASAGGYVLQTANIVFGGWGNSTLPETVEGNDKVVTDPIGTSNKFYRLIKP